MGWLLAVLAVGIYGAILQSVSNSKTGKSASYYSSRRERVAKKYGTRLPGDLPDEQRNSMVAEINDLARTHTCAIQTSSPGLYYLSDEEMWQHTAEQRKIWVTVQNRTERPT